MADHTLNNTTPFISKVKLPSQSTPGQFDEYEIHDERAIHDIKDLGLTTVLDFQGTIATAEDLFMLQSAKKGDVYLVTTGDEKGIEYVCIETYTKEMPGHYPEYWEPLGNIHDAASSTHKHKLSGTLSTSITVQEIANATGGVIQSASVDVVGIAASGEAGTAPSWTATVESDGTLVFDWNPGYALVARSASKTLLKADSDAGLSDDTSLTVVNTIERKDTTKTINLPLADFSTLPPTDNT